MAKERIGILGGTFDPIHTGHIRMAAAARDAAGLDRVLVMPTGNPPHKSDLAPAEDRWRMVCAACAGERGLVPCRTELDRSGVIYTTDTLSILRENYPHAELFYIIGTDTLMELRHWRNYEKVLGQCAFLICPRATDWSPAELEAERRRLTALGGRFQTVATEVVTVSSTEIRHAIATEEATPLLSPVVREYCGVLGLYGALRRVPQAEPWMDMLFRALTVRRFAHSLGVAATARHLALAHGLDAQQAEIAGLLHDCAKCLPLPTMQEMADFYRLTDDPAMRQTDRLLHSLVGAVLADKQYGVHDPEILDAIANHTTGRPGMSRLAIAVYLADKIEPTRRDYPGLDRVRMLAELSLERAMLFSMDSFVAKQGKSLHPATLETLRWLKAEEGLK